MRLWTLVLCLTTIGCEAFKTPPDAYGPDDTTGEEGDETGTDTDPDTTPTDDTGDTTKTDDTGDTTQDDTGGGGGDLDCALRPPAPVPLDECMTGEISCGDTLVATTMRGSDYFNFDDHYASWFCTPFPEGDYDGVERVYSFTHPGGGTYVSIDLESPCAELDLIVLKYPWERNECPTDGALIYECEWEDETGDDSLLLYDSSEAHYYIIVEARNNDEAVFQLSVTCP